MYKYEINFVKDIEKKIVSHENLFKIAGLDFEFNYSDGRTDIIALNQKGDLISFEAKLNHWRKGINQAYRNSSFSHYSYLILPKNVAEKALKEIYEFKLRGIGLCSVDSSGITIEINACRKEPLQPWITKKAMNFIDYSKNEKRRKAS